MTSNFKAEMTAPSTRSSIVKTGACNGYYCNGVPLLLACGAAASYHDYSHGLSLGRQGSNYNNMMNANRFYSSSTARCESNSEKPSSSDKNKSSFFDMIQQWAFDDLPKSRDDSDSNRNATTECNNTQSVNTFGGPEQLARAIGLLECPNSSSFKDSDPTIPPDNTTSTFDEVKDLFYRYTHSTPSPSDKSKKNQNTKDESAMSDFLSFFLTSDKQSSNDMNELIRQAHDIVNPVSSSIQSASMTSLDFLDQIRYFKKNSDDIQSAFETSFGQLFSSYGISISDLFEKMNIATLHYYLEHQDSIKTPSWKRRVHRFYTEVEVEKVEELNQALLLSELSYADSVEEIREGLAQLYGTSDVDYKGGGIAERFRRKSYKPEWELLFCDVESRPNEPSHFVAVQKNASKYDDTLHILMVVRGTKSMSDLMTDALIEATDYEYKDSNGEVFRGKAHSGMVKSGQFLVKRHHKLLSALVDLSNKRKIEINLIGHSLGAGAATIAAMEWNSKGFNQNSQSDASSSRDGEIDVSAHVIGFGCPALLSKQLSIMAQEYCTTVIADADMIPRMSSATLVNLILDLINFDYRKEAERDVEQALKELQYRFAGNDVPSSKKSKLSFNIQDESIQKVMGYVHQGLEKMLSPINESHAKGDTAEIKEKVRDFQKLEPVLYPPGSCIHFFRDGSGISGTYTPCTFYNEVRLC